VGATVPRTLREPWREVLTSPFGFAPAKTRAIRSEIPPEAWESATMTTTKHRKRSALDLLLEAALHPVRFR